MGDFRIVAAGDSTLVVEFEDRIDPSINARAVSLANELESSRLAGVRDIVPTYCSVAVYFDPLRATRARVESWVTVRMTTSGRSDRDEMPPASAIRIPVCYGDKHGPDLAHVAAFADMSEADAVARHAAPVYRVYMLGFLPGFAYMGTVDARIAAPRRTTPRVSVAAGSVGIAGSQTGIYPQESPGGWQLVGRTPLESFDPARREPCLFRAGDAVQFYAIDQQEYRALGGVP